MEHRHTAAADAAGSSISTREPRASKVVFHAAADEDEDYEDYTGTKPGTESASLVQQQQRHDGASAVSADRFAAPSGIPSSIPEDPDDVLNMTIRTRARRPSFLEHADNIRTVLVWQDLTVSSPIRGAKGRKVLLDHVSGSMTG